MILCAFPKWTSLQVINNFISQKFSLVFFFPPEILNLYNMQPSLFGKGISTDLIFYIFLPFEQLDDLLH